MTIFLSRGPECMSVAVIDINNNSGAGRGALQQRDGERWEMLHGSIEYIWHHCGGTKRTTRKYCAAAIKDGEES